MTTTAAVFDARHTLHYDTTKPVPIGDVITALSALKIVLENVPAALEHLTGADIVGSQVIVERLETGSLLETIAVRLFFKDEAELEKFLGKIRENGKVRGLVVGSVIAGLTVYGLHLATSKTAPNITATNNTIINIGAGEFAVTPERFVAAIESAVTNKKETAGAALRMLAPARSDPQSSLSIDGGTDGAIAIPAEAIVEAPRRLPTERDFRVIERPAVTVRLHAIDLDKTKAGWAGSIEGVTPRVKIDFDQTIQPSTLGIRPSFTADVAIIYRRGQNEVELTPREIFVRRLVE